MASLSNNPKRQRGERVCTATNWPEEKKALDEVEQIYALLEEERRKLSDRRFHRRIPGTGVYWRVVSRLGYCENSTSGS